MNTCADEARSPRSPPPRTHSALTIPPPSARLQARSDTHAASRFPGFDSGASSGRMQYMCCSHANHAPGTRPPPALLPSYHPYIHLKYKAQRNAKGARVLLQLARSNVRLAGGPGQHGYEVKISYEYSGPSLYWQSANDNWLNRTQDQTYMQSITVTAETRDTSTNTGRANGS